MLVLSCEPSTVRGRDWQGGGWCESLIDCYGRSKTSLGSSKTFDPIVDFDQVGGYFSSNPESNPQVCLCFMKRRFAFALLPLCRT